MEIDGHSMGIRRIKRVSGHISWSPWLRCGLSELPLPAAFTVAVAACDRASVWQEVRATE